MTNDICPLVLAPLTYLVIFEHSPERKKSSWSAYRKQNGFLIVQCIFIVHPLLANASLQVLLGEGRECPTRCVPVSTGTIYKPFPVPAPLKSSSVFDVAHFWWCSFRLCKALIIFISFLGGKWGTKLSSAFQRKLWKPLSCKASPIFISRAVAFLRDGSWIWGKAP